MKLKNHTVLIVSPESWGTNFVSKHHFALELSKNNKVYFLSPPGSYPTLHQINSNLFVVEYKPSFRGIRKFPEFISGLLVKKEIQSIENICKARFDIIWSFDTSRLFNLSRVKNKFTIAHIVDWTENFNRPALCRTADLCLATTGFIRDEMLKFNANSFNIGHGYYDGYKQSIPPRLPGQGGDFSLKVGYSGNLGIKYIDWICLEKIISDHPGIAFYFFGPENDSNLGKRSGHEPTLKKFKKLKNVFFVGQIPPYEIHNYLEQMDILLVTYLSERFMIQLSNPHKMLEYLGTGKIIVASWTEEYKDMTDLIAMAPENKAIPDLFDEVVENIGAYNHPKKQQERKNYALINSYTAKIKQIEKLINEASSKDN